MTTHNPSNMPEYHCEHSLDPDDHELYIDMKCSCQTPWIQHIVPVNLVPTKGPGSRYSYCIICLEEIEAIALTIEHSECRSCFHANCIHDWSGQAFNCPLCKAEFKTARHTVQSGLHLPEQREAEIRMKILQQYEQPAAYSIKILRDVQNHFVEHISVIKEMYWQENHPGVFWYRRYHPDL
jgi:hypothetical protein